MSNRTTFNICDGTFMRKHYKFLVESSEVFHLRTNDTENWTKLAQKSGRLLTAVTVYRAFNCDWCAKERVTHELYTNTYSCNNYARRPSSRENLSIVSGVRTPVFVSFSVLDRFVNAVTHFSAVLAFFPFIISRLLSWKRDVCKLIAIGGRRLRKRETIKSETHTNTHLMRAFVSSL